MDSKQPLAYECAKIIEKEGYKCALVGGVAVGVWGEERFTKDLDFALAVKTDKDAEKLVKAMVDKGFRIETVLEHKPSDSIALVIFSSPTSDKIPYRVDLIFMQTGIEKEVVENSVVFKVDKKSELRVASVGHLIALKVLSMDDKKRPQDRLDIANLLKVADKNDLETAKKALDLITKREFNQKKDLLQRFKVLQEIYVQEKKGPKLRR